MKPTEPDIKWCVEHKDWVNGLLEKRGWQEGDWCERRLVYGPTLVSKVEDGEPYLIQAELGSEGTFFHMGDWLIIWLPAEGDVLAMLGETDGMPALESNVRKDEPELFWIAYAGRDKSGWQKTPLIALLELLRTVEGKG